MDENILDGAVEPQGNTGKEKISLFDNDGAKKSQATLLIEIGQQFELFHCPNKEAYAQIGKQVLSVASKAFKDKLSHEFFTLTGKGCNGKAIADALATLESIAKYDSPEHVVYNRVANLGDKIYIDIGCNNFRVIEITTEGWQTLDIAPVKFVRKQGFAALPEPVKGGELSGLKSFLNIHNEQLPLALGFIFCAVAGISPYPILILQGEQGTGKSTTSRVIRSFIDPSTVPLRNPPKDPRDLIVSAANSHCVVLDNLSGLKPEFSDCLCRLSTGGGHDLRKLYTDMDQSLIDVQRPVMVNGIDDIATRPDLAERALILNLPVINDIARKTENEFWQDFDKSKPILLGAILAAIAAGLKHRSSIQLPIKPRMADAAIWITACESAFNPETPFINAHRINQQEAIELSIEASPVGSAIIELMANREYWTGTPTNLFKALAAIAGESQTRGRAWPQSTKGLKASINRLKASFRKIGINIDEGKSGNRFYEIRKVENKPSKPSDPPKPAQDKAFSENAIRPQASKWTDNRLDKPPNRPQPSNKKTNKSDAWTVWTDRADKFQHGENNADVERF